MPQPSGSARATVGRAEAVVGSQRAALQARGLPIRQAAVRRLTSLHGSPRRHADDPRPDRCPGPGPRDRPRARAHPQGADRERRIRPALPPRGRRAGDRGRGLDPLRAQRQQRHQRGRGARPAGRARLRRRRPAEPARQRSRDGAADRPQPHRHSARAARARAQRDRRRVPLRDRADRHATHGLRGPDRRPALLLHARGPGRRAPAVPVLRPAGSARALPLHARPAGDLAGLREHGADGRRRRGDRRRRTLALRAERAAADVSHGVRVRPVRRRRGTDPARPRHRRLAAARVLPRLAGQAPRHAGARAAAQRRAALDRERLRRALPVQEARRRTLPRFPVRRHGARGRDLLPRVGTRLRPPADGRGARAAQHARLSRTVASSGSATSSR